MYSVSTSIAFMRLIILFLLFSGAAAFADEIAPDFSLPEIQSGEIHHLKDYRGKVVYLDFWASWCGPCRQSLPALNQLQKELDKSEFEVLAINLDMYAEEGRRFLESYPVDYTVLKDTEGQTSRAYDIMGLPSSVLISPDGIVVSHFQGFHPDHIKKLKRAIQILNE